MRGDPGKTCISLEMSQANKKGEYFTVVAPFVLFSKEVACVFS